MCEFGHIRGRMVAIALMAVAVSIVVGTIIAFIDDVVVKYEAEVDALNLHIG